MLVAGNFLATGHFVEEGPTVGLNVKVLQKGGVTTKIWDLGGQTKYRSEWTRYTKGCDVICFTVDTQAPELLPDAKRELHQLLESDRELSRVPLLVLATKIDLMPKITEPELIKGSSTSADGKALRENNAGCNTSAHLSPCLCLARSLSSPPSVVQPQPGLHHRESLAHHPRLLENGR